jgi:hypothetical protein
VYVFSVPNYEIHPKFHLGNVLITMSGFPNGIVALAMEDIAGRQFKYCDHTTKCTTCEVMFIRCSL